MSKRYAKTLRYIFLVPLGSANELGNCWIIFSFLFLLQICLCIRNTYILFLILSLWLKIILRIHRSGKIARPMDMDHYFIINIIIGLSWKRWLKSLCIYIYITEYRTSEKAVEQKMPLCVTSKSKYSYATLIIRGYTKYLCLKYYEHREANNNHNEGCLDLNLLPQKKKAHINFSGQSLFFFSNRPIRDSLKMMRW